MIIELTPSHFAAYERFLDQIPQSMIYASLVWRELLERYLGAEPHYLVKLEGENISAALPTFITEVPGYGAVANSLPFYGSNGGVLSKEDDEIDSKRELLGELDRVARAKGCLTLTVITSPFERHESVYGETLNTSVGDHRIGQVTHLSPLDADESHLLSRCESSARRNVAKARRVGVEVVESDDEVAWNYLIATHQANMEAIGGRGKSDRFFQCLRKALTPSQHYRLFVATRSGRPVAALLLLYFNCTVEYFTPAISSDERSSQALSLLLCESLKDAAANGFRWWNWGGTWQSQHGVFRFKRKWAAESHPYSYFVKLYPGFERIASMSKEAILEIFPDFYVCPFSQLGNASRLGEKV